MIKDYDAIIVGGSFAGKENSMRGLLAVLILAMGSLTTPSAWAQAPGSPSDPHQHQSATPPSSSTTGAAPTMGMPGMSMEMCQQMMGAMMGMPMGHQTTDPKTMAQMMEMRGEMMRAMGDIMMKHAKRMQAPR